jgi:predicted transcriptional regulator
MSGSEESTSGPRKSAEWMTSTDDRILENLRAEGGRMTPSWLSKEGEISRVDVSTAYVQKRLGYLVDAGLVENPERGAYMITERGESYLHGEFDVSTVEDPA